jgi:hypothetical protein
LYVKVEGPLLVLMLRKKMTPKKNALEAAYPVAGQEELVRQNQPRHPRQKRRP